MKALTGSRQQKIRLKSDIGRVSISGWIMATISSSVLLCISTPPCDVNLSRHSSQFPITISDNSSCFSKNQQVGSLIIQHACITPGCCFKSEEENQHSLAPPLFQVVPQHIMCVSHMIPDMAVTYWDLLTWVLSMNVQLPRQLNPMKTWQLMYSPWWLGGFFFEVRISFC